MAYFKNGNHNTEFIPGRAEIINMLITRCRTLDKDQKNHLGLTPLMKAALQGRSKCAKILLLGGKQKEILINL